MNAAKWFFQFGVAAPCSGLSFALAATGGDFGVPLVVLGTVCAAVAIGYCWVRL